MPVITDISPQKRRLGRVNIYVDDVFAFGASEQFVVDQGLRVNKSLTAQEYDLLLAEVVVDAAFQSCLNFLSFRPRSIAEVEQYINKKYPQLSPDTVASLIERLTRMGYLDDEAFARWWIQQRREVGKRWGPHKIRQELITKGIDTQVIETALQESQSAISEKELVLRELTKLQRRYPDMRPYETRAKVMNTLARRGFSWDVIKETVEELING